MGENLMVGSHKSSNDKYRKRHEETFKYGCKKCRELEKLLPGAKAFKCIQCGKEVNVYAP
jgi:LSD1 subclass zinc finger protein